MSNNIPLHRVCSLVRKQGASFVLVEDCASDPEIAQDIDDLDKRFGGQGAAEAIAISFFTGSVSPKDIAAVASDSLLAKVRLINYRQPTEREFTHTYIYDCVARVPGASDGNVHQVRLLNNFIPTTRIFDVVIAGRNFLLESVYFTQQNAETHVCAHAALRSAINTLKSTTRQVDSRSINSDLGLQDPSKGLSISDIEKIIGKWSCDHPVLYNCSGLRPEEYITLLSAFIESGCPALLVFNTLSSQHVVSVFGHTHNSDEWHPQAIPAYSGPSSARYLKSSRWVDHFLIHDDNFGPYYTLNSRALDVDPNVRAQYIVAIAPLNISVPPTTAEAISTALLSNALPSLAETGNSQWFDFITKDKREFVLRPTLVAKSAYLDHIRSSRGHDNSKMEEHEIATISDIEDYAWMVEFSTPALYTGNHSKLGEVLIRCDTVSETDQGIMVLRIPDKVLRVQKNGVVSVSPSSLKSHSPLNRLASHPHTW